MINHEKYHRYEKRSYCWSQINILCLNFRASDMDFILFSRLLMDSWQLIQRRHNDRDVILTASSFFLLFSLFITYIYSLFDLLNLLLHLLTIQFRTFRQSKRSLSVSWYLYLLLRGIRLMKIYQSIKIFNLLEYLFILFSN